MKILKYTQSLKIYYLQKGRIYAAARMMSSDAPQRFGTAKGHSGWTWDNNGIGMGGNDIMFRHT